MSRSINSESTSSFISSDLIKVSKSGEDKLVTKSNAAKLVSSNYTSGKKIASVLDKDIYIPTRSITLVSNPSGAGTLTKSSSRYSEGYIDGELITISETHSDQYKFSGWTATGSGKLINSSSSTTNYQIKGNSTITANYDSNQFLVQFIVDGVVEKSEVVNYGGSATPPSLSKTGYVLSPWTGEYTNVTSDRNIYASWSVSSYTLTINVSSFPFGQSITFVNGSFSESFSDSSRTYTVSSGTIVTLSSGKSMSVNGINYNSTYSYTMPSSNSTLNVLIGAGIETFYQCKSTSNTLSFGEAIGNLAPGFKYKITYSDASVGHYGNSTSHVLQARYSYKIGDEVRYFGSRNIGVIGLSGRGYFNSDGPGGSLGHWYGTQSGEDIGTKQSDSTTTLDRSKYMIIEEDSLKKVVSKSGEFEYVNVDINYKSDGVTVNNVTYYKASPVNGNCKCCFELCTEMSGEYILDLTRETNTCSIGISVHDNGDQCTGVGFRCYVRVDLIT